MADKRLVNRWILCGSLFGLGAIVALSTCIGVIVGTRVASKNVVQIPTPLSLNAGTAARGKSISMATGSIDGNVEGLYILDHFSGNLQCWLMNARTGEVGGIYRANVAQDLVTDKSGEPDYVMTTGNFFYTGGNTGNQAPGQSIVYVADVNTGNVVGYLLAYNKQGIQRGIAQTGVLQPVCKGAAREVALRDQ